NIYLESLKREPKVAPLPILPAPDPPDERERKFHCLEHCLAELGENNRDLILEYYRGDKRAKIEHRKELMAASGQSVNTFRMRIHRLKLSLQSCLKKCLKRAKV